MFNLIKMDLYRLVRTPSALITAGMADLLAVFSVFMTDTDIQLMQEDPSSVSTEAPDERQMGIYVEADPEWLTGKIEAGSIVSVEMRSGLLALLCVIFTAVFVNAEHRSGFIKNIAGQLHSRGKLIISKLTAVAVQVLFMMIVFIIAVLITGFILWGGSFYIGSAASLFKFAAIQYLLHLSLSAMIIFFTVLTGSSAFSMTLGILLCSGLSVPVYSLINKLVYNFRPGLGFDINKFLPDGNITLTGIDASAEVFLRGAVSGAVYALIFILLSMLIMQKRDVR